LVTASSAPKVAVTTVWPALVPWLPGPAELGAVAGAAGAAGGGFDGSAEPHPVAVRTATTIVNQESARTRPSSRSAAAGNTVTTGSSQPTGTLGSRTGL